MQLTQLTGLFPPFSGAGAAPFDIGTLSVTFLSPALVNLLLATNTGGTPPYSGQLQRAPDVSGSPGSYGDLGGPVAGSTMPFSDDTVVAGAAYWYRVIVADSAAAEDTSNEVRAVVPSSGGGPPSMLIMGIG